jgi:hypothetical protein
VLETQALQRVRQLDVDAEVIRIELELVARLNAALLVDIECERGEIAVDRKPPVDVTVRMRIKGHHRAFSFGRRPRSAGVKLHVTGECRIVHDRWRSTSRSWWEP